MFSGTKSSDFVYLYSRFGNAGPSQAGFEEWALVNAPSIPQLKAPLAFATEHLPRNRARLGVKVLHFGVSQKGDCSRRLRFFLESSGAALPTVPRRA